MSPTVRDDVRVEFAPGVHWLCGCLSMEFKGQMIHGYSAGYLVVGDERSLIVDTGHPSHWGDVERKLLTILDGRPLDYIFPSHTELPHAGNLSRLLRRWPDAQIVGDSRDYHLYFPDVPRERYLDMRPGDGVDLGGRRFSFHTAIIRDLPNTLWGFDDGSGTLFVADGFGFYHFHDNDDCGRTAEELGELTTDQVSFLNDAALSWVRWRELDPILQRTEELIQTLGVTALAPAHGSVVAAVDATYPMLREKLLEGRMNTAGVARLPGGSR